MKRLWEVLLRLAEEETDESLSCEDCYMLLDCLSDLMSDGYKPAELMPVASKYLRRCPDCQREYIAALAELLPELQDPGGSRDRPVRAPPAPGSPAVHTMGSAG